MSPSTRTWDVLIIGSGISSLACAILLLKKGKSVLVLEQHYKPGGYLHNFREHGLLFETGAHYIGALDPNQPFRAMLEFLGVYDESLFTPLDPNGFDEFVFPSFRVQFAKGYPETIERFSEIFPKEREAITQFFDLVKHCAQTIPFFDLESIYNAEEARYFMETTVQSIVEPLTQNPRLQNAFYAYCAFHGVMPKDASFGHHACAIDSVIRGPYTFRRGGDDLARKFVEEIKRLGGEVKLKTLVTELETKNKEIVGIKDESGETYQATQIISGIHPKILFNMVDPSSLYPIFKKRLNSYGEVLSVSGVYAKAIGPTSFKPYRNYYFFAEDTPEVFEMQDNPVSGPRGAFVSCPNRNQNVNQSYPLSIYFPTPYEWFLPWSSTQFDHRPEEYHRFKENLGQKAIDFVEKFEPGFKKTLQVWSTSSPLTNLHYNRSHQGSAYGLYKSIDTIGIRGMGTRSPFKNLLMTGQNTFSSGIFASTISAFRTCGNILGMKNLLTDFKNSSL